MTQKVVVPAEPIVLKRDEQKISAFTEGLKSLAAKANAAIREFENLEAGELTLEALQGLLRKDVNVDEYTRNRKVNGKPVKVGGMVFAPEKVAEMLDIDTARFVQAVRAIANHVESSRQYPRVPVTLAQLELVEGVAFPKETAVKAMEESCSLIAKTEAQKEAYLILKRVAEDLDYLSETHTISVISSQNTANNILRQLNEGNGYKVHINLEKVIHSIAQ